MAMCLPAFFRRFWWRLMPVALAGLFLSNSTGGMLAFAVGVVFWFACYGHRFWPLALSLAALVAYTWFVDRGIWISTSFTDRWDWVVLGWGYIEQRPLMGYGLGHWQLVTRQLHAHNEFLQLVFEMGWIGGLTVIGYIASSFYRASRTIVPGWDVRHGLEVPLTALVIIIVSAASCWTFHIAPTALVALTWMAILEIKLRADQ